jgi:hypothetical protein
MPQHINRIFPPKKRFGKELGEAATKNLAKLLGM